MNFQIFQAKQIKLTVYQIHIKITNLKNSWNLQHLADKIPCLCRIEYSAPDERKRIGAKRALYIIL